MILCTKLVTNETLGFPGSSTGKESTCNAGDLSLLSGSGRSRGRKGVPTPVFFPGESHGQRSLPAAVHGVTRVGHSEATERLQGAYTLEQGVSILTVRMTSQCPVATSVGRPSQRERTRACVGAAVYGVTQSRTRLKRLSMAGSLCCIVEMNTAS